MSVTIAATQQMIRQYAGLPAPVYILCLGSFVNRAGSFAMVFLTIYVSERLNYGVTFATKCFGVFGVGSIVASLVGGQLADRFGRRPIMLLAVFGGAATLLVISFVTDRWLFLGLILIYALLNDMYRPAASAMIGDLVDSLQRPHAFGLMYIAFNLGFAVAAPIGGFLANRSFQLLFWGDALTTAIYGGIILVLIRETRPESLSAQDPVLIAAPPSVGDPVIGAQSAASGRAASDSLSAALKYIVRDSTFLLFSLATLLTSIVFMQAFSTLPVYMKQLGHSEQEVGLLLSTNGILIVVLQLPVTYLLSRFNRVVVILFGEFLTAVGFGMTTFADVSLVLILSIVVWTLGEVVQAAFKQSLVVDLAPKHLRARYMGIFSLCHAMGLTIGAPLGGMVLESLGAQVLWSSCFVIVMAAVAVYGIVFLQLSRGTSLSKVSTG